MAPLPLPFLSASFSGTCTFGFVVIDKHQLKEHSIWIVPYLSLPRLTGSYWNEDTVIYQDLLLLVRNIVSYSPSSVCSSPPLSSLILFSFSYVLPSPGLPPPPVYLHSAPAGSWVTFLEAALEVQLEWQPSRRRAREGQSRAVRCGKKAFCFCFLF